MDCRDVQVRLSDLQDGTLVASVADAVSVHLRTCAECGEIARTLGALRYNLRELPIVPAPAELLLRIREALGAETARSPSAVAATVLRTRRAFFDRLRVPLEAAAVVLLVGSVYWYQSNGPAAFAPRATVDAPRVTASSPASAPAAGTAAVPARREKPTTAARAVARQPRLQRESIATLPPGTPDPKVRVWSRADLPAAPALRTSTDAEPVVPGFPEGEAEAGAASAPAAMNPEPPAASSRVASLAPYGRQIDLSVKPEDRPGSEDRIGAIVRRLGGTVAGVDSIPGGDAAVRVLLPERAAPEFLDGLHRLGTIGPEEGSGEGAAGDRQHPGALAYTVRVRTR
jgi:Putative zinc-finger